MNTINLTNKEASNLKFEVSHFPDGQQDLCILPYSVAEIKTILESKDLSIQINARFNSFEDLEIILCATKALRRLGIKKIHLYIPYLLGARSDRQFQEGGNSYLVDIIAPILNAQGFESVTVYDVHSDVAAACINNLKVIDNVNLVKFALNSIYNEKT